MQSNKKYAKLLIIVAMLVLTGCSKNCGGSGSMDGHVALCGKTFNF